MKKSAYIVFFVFFILILYLNLGDFFFGGRSEIILTGEHINKLCAANSACPVVIDGWQKTASGKFQKDRMLYIPETERVKGGPQSFRLIYVLTMPKPWFEVQGGVGKVITSGWKSGEE